MKKTLQLLSAALLVIIGNVKAQTIADGINHLYADRFKTAENTFKTLLNSNPNNIEAIYWLGQTYLDMDDNDAARDVYQKALASNGNAPLVLVGMGHVDLLFENLNEARQRFETSLSMTRTRKGDDPAILTAIGRANVDAKKGDLEYAIEKLKMAVERDPKNADAYLQLGNAYRKANPGQGGGDAYVNYKKAIDVNPSFVYPHLRIAKLFETQKNWDFVLQNLNDAVAKDPKFSLAYYELFYYYFFRQDYVQAESMLNKYIQSKQPEIDVQDDYLYAQLCWAKKDYACAISRAQNVENAMGSRTKPKIYKLLAVAYADKGDTANAKPYIDKYFAREKPEDLISYDLILKGKIYAATTGDETVVFESYIKAADLDSIYSDKIKTLQEGADYFRMKGNKRKEAEMKEILYSRKKDPSDAELFNVGLAYYQAQDYNKAIEKFNSYYNKNRDSIYGPFWAARASSAIDTAMTEGLAIPYYQKTIDIAEKDKERLKGMGIEGCGYLAGYHNNIKSDPEMAIIYIKKGLEFDSTNTSLKSTLDILMKATQNKQNQPKSSPKTNKSVSFIRKPVAVRSDYV